MAPGKRTTRTVARPGKRRRLDVDALTKLKTFGDLAQMVEEYGQLSEDVKVLLEQLAPEELRSFFLADNHGWKLFSAICKKNHFDEVRYAIEQLGLNDQLPINASPYTRRFDPLLSALDAREPQPDVIWYLTAQGCVVSKEAFYSWTSIRGTKTQLRCLLAPLVKFGRRQMPPISSLLDKMTLQHLKVLRDFVDFTVNDLHNAASGGHTSAVDLMSARCQAVTRRQKIALVGIFEFCEVFYLLYRNPKKAIKTLKYFRKSLEYRSSGRTYTERTSFAEWKLFDSIEDIERLEKQLSEGDYIETVWQMFFVSARLQLTLELALSRFFRALPIDRLDELARMKSFVLDTNAFFPSMTIGERENFKRQFLRRFYQYCLVIITKIPRIPVTMLPNLYNCFREVLVISNLRATNGLINAISTLDVTDLSEQVETIKEWSDECLFVLSLAFAPKPSIEWSILKLLDQHASVKILPGQQVSALDLIVAEASNISDNFRKELAARICCRMDTRLSHDTVGSIDTFCCRAPTTLRCLAAISCSNFNRETLEQNLPADLVPFVLKHIDGRLNYSVHI